MRKEPIRTKKKKSQEVKRPNQFNLPRVAFKGTGTYTPPASAARREREGT